MNAHLVLVHQVAGLVPGLADNDSRREIIESEKEEALSKLITMVQQTGVNPDMVSYEVTEKNILLSLSELLKTGTNDMILVGLKGTGFLKQIFIGSTAKKVIDELNILTAAVPVKLTHLIPEKMIVAVNDKFPLNEQAFDTMLDLFQNTVGHLEFISVASSETESSNEDYLSKLSARFNEKIPATFRILKEDDAFLEIKNYINQFQQSILVVQKGPRSIQDHFFRKFFINDLVHDGTLPLLIIPS